MVGDKMRTYCLTRDQQNGINLEKPMLRFFETLGLGSVYDHNSFKPWKYPLDNHNIVDGVLQNYALVECTNPKETTFMNDNIMRKKLDYFIRKDPKHFYPFWVLIVSFMSCLSTAILDLIDRLGIILIEIGHHAETTNKRTIINALYHSRLYSLVKQLIKSRKTDFRPDKVCISQSRLPSYSYSVSSSSITKDNYLHQHNEPKQDSTNQHQNNIDRIKRLLDHDNPDHG
jgi:hypothetical protein